MYIFERYEMFALSKKQLNIKVSNDTKLVKVNYFLTI